MCRFLLPALLAFPVPLKAAETLSQLITDARVLTLDAASSTRQRFSDTQITQFLNVGQRQAMINNHCLQQNLVFQLVPGTTYYSLPSNYLAITRVTIGSKWLLEMTPASLDGRSRSWETASGYPTYYFTNYSSRSLVGFAPWPATSSDTDTVKVEYDIQANDLINSTDQPFNGINELQDYHHMLAYFAAYVMETIEGQTAQAQAFLGIYTNGVKEMTNHCTERPNYLPSAAGTQ